MSIILFKPKWVSHVTHWGWVTHIYASLDLSSLVRVMACRLFGAKPLPKPMFTFCQMVSRTFLMTFPSKFESFHAIKSIWKCRLQNVGHFVLSSMEGLYLNRISIRLTMIFGKVSGLPVLDWLWRLPDHYCGVVVYSTVYSGPDQRKRQSTASLAFVRGIHRWPVNYPHKGPVTRRMFPFDDVIMYRDSHYHHKTVVIVLLRESLYP